MLEVGSKNCQINRIKARFIMTFLKTSMISLGALAVLAACGGANEGSAPTSAPTENTVENSGVSTESSTVTDVEAEVAVEEPEFAPEFASLPEPYKSADFNRGKRTYRLCQSCHTLAEGGPNLIGPNMYGVFGRQVGGVEGFNYSNAVKEADFIWTPEMLNEWLVSPRDFLPGNNMSFAGVRREEDRLGVIAYIMAETGYAAE